MELIGSKILVEPLEEEKTDLEESLKKVTLSQAVANSAIGKVLKVSNECSSGIQQKIKASDTIIYRPFDCVELPDGSVLIDQERIICKV